MHVNLCGYEPSRLLSVISLLNSGKHMGLFISSLVKYYDQGQIFNIFPRMIIELQIINIVNHLHNFLYSPVVT